MEKIVGDLSQAAEYSINEKNKFQFIYKDFIRFIFVQEFQILSTFYHYYP